jgi:hypothetical protein
MTNGSSVGQLYLRAGWGMAACAIALLGMSQTSPSPEQKARAACTGCHAFPPADILPSAAWRDEVVRMMFFREKRVPPPGSMSLGRTVKLPPDLEEALAFYASAAPDRLPAPDAWPPESESPLTFARRTWTLPEMADPPAVSHVQLVDVDGDARLDLVGADMRHGVVFAGRSTQQGGAVLSPLAIVPHPSHVTIADVDRDGLDDLVVSDLGEFFPADHKKAAVILLRGQAGGKYAAFWLDGWPRVASVRAADVNADGKIDLAVAAFGWHAAGQVAVLENRTLKAPQPDFATHTVDPRTGSVDVIPVDLNRDGRMDLVSLLAQEHESVVAYINKGDGFTFDQRVIYAAPHPNWGSSGLQVIDLDKDGDFDVLLAHGDSFDDGIVKPYHGIQWLENTGSYPFVERTLARMPGVHALKAADLDGDGDLDIAAAALLAGGSDVDERGLPAVVWLEQTKPGTFVRHTIAMGFPRHATLDVGDLDRDGDLDVVVGNFSLERRAMPSVVGFLSEKRR